MGRMLHELDPADYGRVLPLMADEPPGFPMALSILSGAAKGRVYVDRIEQPRGAIALASTGWHAALGVWGTEEAADVAALVFGQEALVFLERFGIWVSRLALLGQGLGFDQAFGGDLKKRRMVVWQVDPNRSEKAVSDSRIQDLSLDGYEQASRFSHMLKAYWPDANDLVRRGFAKAFVENGETKGICYTCFHSGSIHEPHIVVREADRGKGIGKMLAAAYTDSIMQRGGRLFWSHYEDNQASERCAKAAGFRSYGAFKVLQYIKKSE